MLISSGSCQALGLFIIDGFMVGLSSWYLARFIETDRLLERFILFVLAGSAVIIVSTYFLSLIKQIQPLGYLIFHTVLFFCIFLFKPKRHPASVLASGMPLDFGEIKKHPLIVIMGAALVIFFVVSFFLGFFVPPNNWDSMSYHLSRVGYWLQNRTLSPYLVQDTRQLYLLPNAEILLLWPIVF